MTVASFPVGSFGDELDDLRRARGLTFRALAAGAGVSAGYLCNLAKGRRGHRPSDALIRRVADGLEVDPAEFSEWRCRRVLEHPDLVDELYGRLR